VGGGRGVKAQRKLQPINNNSHPVRAQTREGRVTSNLYFLRFLIFMNVYQPTWHHTPEDTNLFNLHFLLVSWMQHLYDTGNYTSKYSISIITISDYSKMPESFNIARSSKIYFGYSFRCSKDKSQKPADLR
jgi:hypothetical protein